MSGWLLRLRGGLRQLFPVPGRTLLQLGGGGAGGLPSGQVRQRRCSELLRLRGRLLQRVGGAGVLSGLPGRPRVPRQDFGAGSVLLGDVQLRERHRVRGLPGGVLLLKHWKLAGGLHRRVVLARQLGVLRVMSAGTVLYQHCSGLCRSSLHTHSTSVLFQLAIPAKKLYVPAALLNVCLEGCHPVAAYLTSERSSYC